MNGNSMLDYPAKMIHISKLIHNFLVQFEATTKELFDAITSVRHELQVDLIFLTENKRH